MPRAKSVVVVKAKRSTASRAVVRRRAPRATTTRRYAIRGHGGYWDNVKSRWGEGGGSMKSQFEDAGNLIGGPLGRQAGGLINRAIYALTGFGDYKVQSNALLETNGPPAVLNRGKEFVVRHREYISDIYSLAGTANTPSGFGIQSFAINPGNFSTFPWLSSIADKFEQYRIEGMIFEFKSLYSDAVVTQNGSIGSIILATEYNSGAPAFTSKQAMENYQFAQSCKPSLSVLHPIECARSQNVLSELYVRPGAVPAGEDVKTYDFGDFQIASQGIPLGSAGAAVNLGELWISYQIALIKPKIPTVASSYIDSGYSHFSSLSSYAGAFTTANPAPKLYLGVDIITPTSSSNIPITHPSDNAFVLQLSSVPMKYQIDIYWRGVSAVATADWSGPTLAVNNGSFVFGGPTALTEVIVPAQTVAGATAGRGVAVHYILSVPAATPSAPTATISMDTVSAKFPSIGIKFDMFINAVPTNVD